MRISLVAEQSEVATGHVLLLAGRGVIVEQRHQLGVVAGLSGGQPDRDRGFPLIGQGVNLGGEPAARAADRVIVGLIGRFLVIRQSPLGRACRSVRPRNVDVPARSSNPPPAASRCPRPSRRRTRISPPPGRTSRRRCRPRTIGDAASTPFATVRNRLAGPAMGYQCGIAMRSPPVSNDGHRTCCPACPHPMASPIRQPSKTDQKSHPFASPANRRWSTPSHSGDTP